MTVFGDRAIREVIKDKWGHESGSLIWQHWCPYNKRKRHHVSLSVSLSLSLSLSPPACVHRKCRVRTQEKGIIRKPRRAPSPGIQFAGTLSLDSSTQNYEKINLCCLSHPACGTLCWQPEQTTTGSITRKRFRATGNPSWTFTFYCNLILDILHIFWIFQLYIHISHSCDYSVYTNLFSFFWSELCSIFILATYFIFY